MIVGDQYAGIDDSCELCDSECDTCEQAGQCLTCREEFLWHNNECVTKCPQGWKEKQ